MRDPIGNRFIVRAACVFGLALLSVTSPSLCRSASQAIQQDDVRLQLERGETLLRQGNHKGAAQAARRALEQNPSSADGHYLLGRVFLNDRKPEKAAEEFTRSLALRPASPVLRDLAAVYVLQGKPAEAEQTLLQAIKADPNHVASYLDLANLYERRQDPASAKKTYQRILAVSPNQPEALFQLATLLDQQGESKEAREIVTRLTTASPKHADGWYL